MMTRTRGEIAQAKLRRLELYSRDPRISDAEVCRVCKLNAKTVAKYRKELFALLDDIRAKVSETIDETEKETVGIWQKIGKILG